MIKIIFLKKKEIEEIVNENLCASGTYSELIYNDDISDEQVLIKRDNEVLDVVEMEEVLNIIETTENVDIKSYDVYEVSNLGDGFAFNIA